MASTVIGSVLAFLVTLSPTVAAPQSLPTADALIVECGQAVTDMETGVQFSSRAIYCLGLVRGVLETAFEWYRNDVMQGVSPSHSPICRPDDRLTVGRAIRFTHRYLTEHPERLHERDTVLVMDALREAFACP